MGRLKVIAAMVLALVLMGTLGFFLTKDSSVADHTTEETMLELKTNQKASEDTQLEKNKYTKVNALIQQYYAQKTNEQQFVNSYENIMVYTMPAEVEGDYITYATYQMKIPDVTTLLPGMESFYVRSTGPDAYEIADISENETLQQEVSEISQEEEVQELIQTVEDQYTKAREADSDLDFALAELQKAYQ
ncbi:MAG: hypothetical protein PHW34_02710 [Hespellia sp.]|nr:hypothetical protein [Hespellia sp.]